MSVKVPDKKIVVILPAYHAVKTLQRTVEAIPREWVDEVILVDDASSDDTAVLARSLGITTIVHQTNTGYGGNQKTCYREALARGGAVIVMVHPDFQYHPKFIPDLIREIVEGGGDVAFGSRMMVRGKALEGGMPRWKYIANIFLTKVENFVLGLCLTEYHSGFRAYSRKVLESIPLEANANGFSFDSEIIVQLRLLGYSIKEIPITTSYFKGASMIGFWKSVQYGFSILKLLSDYLFFFWGVRSDPRFLVRRHACPICKDPHPFLYYRARGSISGLTTYTITENSVGIHDDIFFCRNCKSAFQISSSPTEDIAAAYAAQLCDPIYLQEAKGRRRSFQRIVERLERLIRGRKILDVGAGPGLFLLEAKSRGWEVAGVEPSSAAREYAKETFGIELLGGGVDELARLPDGSFDVVSAIDVIEHLPNPAILLDQVRRLVAPGGVAVLTTPRFDSALSRLMGDRWYAILPSHLTYFSKRGLFQLIRDSGLAVQTARHFTRYFSPAYLWFRLAPYLGMPAVPRAGSRFVPVQLFDEFELYLKKRNEA